MAPRNTRRRVGGSIIAAAAAAASAWHLSSAFVGQSVGPSTRAVNLSLEAAKEKGKGVGFDGKEEEAKSKRKKKQKLSLSEALERQKSKVEEQVVKKEEAKLSPEFTFWEGPPSSTEVLFPFLSCFVVIGVIPFISAVNRQFRVKYKVTDRRVSVAGGWDGNDVTEFSYQEIYEMKYGLRFFGYCGDMRINLRDGAKVEMFGLMNFEENYKFILDRVDKECVKRSDPIPSEMDSLN